MNHAQNISTILFSVALLTVGLLLSAHPAQASETQLVFGAPPQSHEAAFNVLQKAYGRLGISIKEKIMPPNRSIVEADKGITDGEMNRIKGLEKKYPNLVRIPVAIDYFDLYAITRSDATPVQTVGALKHLKVGIVKGIRFAEQLTQDVLIVTRAERWRTLFDLLAMGRIDVILAPETIKTDKGRRGLGIHYTRTPLKGQRQYLYHYLNKKHEEIIQPLTAVLGKMSKSREIRAIIKRAKR